MVIHLNKFVCIFLLLIALAQGQVTQVRAEAAYFAGKVGCFPELA
jgi:hypothetical protein